MALVWVLKNELDFMLCNRGHPQLVQTAKERREIWHVSWRGEEKQDSDAGQTRMSFWGGVWARRKRWGRGHTCTCPQGPGKYIKEEQGGVTNCPGKSSFLGHGTSVLQQTSPRQTRKHMSPQNGARPGIPASAYPPLPGPVHIRRQSPVLPSGNAEWYLWIFQVAKRS